LEGAFFVVNGSENMRILLKMCGKNVLHVNTNLIFSLIAKTCNECGDFISHKTLNLTAESV
jgi:hypothetical protein